MKVRKSELKRLIKQCIVEIIQEDPNVGRMLVKEAIVDMFGERMLMGDAPARSSERRKPRRTNVPAMMASGKRQAATRRQQPAEIDEPGDLFENIMADTMMNTLPDQIAGDRSNPRSRSWAEMVDDGNNMEDGPLMRLRDAAMLPDPNAERRAAMMAPQAQMNQQQLAQLQMMQQAPQQAPSPIGEPTQAQLAEMYKLQQGQQGQQLPPQAQPVSQVPNDLAALGLDGKQWDAHIDSGPSPMAQNPGLDPNLAAIAASINQEFAS